MITISDFTSGLRINSLCQEFIPWSNSKVNACKPFVSFCKENEIGENVRLLNPAAVQTDYLSGKIGVFIAEMVHQVSYLFCPSQAAGRDFFYQGNQLLFFQPLVHLCVNGSAGYGIDLDTAGGQLLGERLSKCVDSAFVAEYAASQEAPARPHTEEMFTILPCF